MTAPDPTAGEAVTDPDTGVVYFPDDPTPNPNAATRTSPPAVAASTGTSEDVEALAKVRVLGRSYPLGHEAARAVVASDWLAAREAAARAEERERIAQAIEALAPPAPHTVTPATVGRQATRSALMTAAHIAREGR